MASRLPEPAWLGRVNTALLDDQDLASAEHEFADDLYFPVLVRPLLASSRTELEVRLRAVADAADGVRAFDPACLAEQLSVPLPAALDRMVLRTLVLELHSARRQGHLRAANPGARFAEFALALGTASRRKAVFGQYPVLARQLAVEADGWLNRCVQFARQVQADQASIGEAFGSGGLGLIDRVVPGLGDRHRGGTVAWVRWSGGLELMYKPRPMAVDAHFQQLLAWAGAKDPALALRTLTCLDRGDHGWMEFAAASPCASEAARHRFYFRQGSLLALLYLLGASDIHAENLIAADEDPMVVDLETLIQPGLPLDTAGYTAAERAAIEAARGSVLTVGLLPHRSWTAQAGGSVDLSGLGFAPGQPAPLPVPTVRNARTDEMSVELSSRAMRMPAHRPVGDGPPSLLLDYAGDIVAGFTQAYRLCEEHRAELAAGPLASFRGDEVRVIVRPTMWYGTILETSFHPDVLRDALDRERHFDALWREAPKSPVLAACAEHERADLWRNEIPVFSARSDGRVLRDSSGCQVTGLILTPGIDRMRSRLAALGPDDLARQRWLITSALGTSAATQANDRELVRCSQPEPAGPAGLDSDPVLRLELLAAAESIGRRLGETAFQSEGSAQWLGPNSPQGNTWSVGPLKADLYHGLTGIALFLGHLGALTADAAHTALARRSLSSARHQIDRGAVPRHGGMAGAAGIIYTCTELARLWGDETLLDTAEQCAWRLIPEARNDTTYDFMAGSAGDIAGLLALYECRPADRLLAQIRACADRLVASAIRSDTGIGWLGNSLRDVGGADRPVAGFAHGGAGVSAALFKAADLLGEARYRQAALEAMAHDQALYDQDTGTWNDLRGRPGRPALTTWCYGAVGIGLGRLSCLAYAEAGGTITRAEIGSALTAAAGHTLDSHCLCHGEAGNLELYLTAADVLKEPGWYCTATERAAELVADAGRRGWRCGTPLSVEAPGLMVGLAGIGYGLLRTAVPSRVPAVLTLQPNFYPGMQDWG